MLSARRVLSGIRSYLAAGRVLLTKKARREMDVLRMTPEDVYEVLGGLTEEDFFAGIRSERTGEWMYVFKPGIVDIVVYLKVVLRDDCVVISFHEDEDEEE